MQVYLNRIRGSTILYRISPNKVATTTRIAEINKIAITTGQSLEFNASKYKRPIPGYFGGIIDDLIQRFVEFFLTLPLLPLLLAFSALLRGVQIPWLPAEWSSAVIISIILTVFGWMGSSRLMRGMVLAQRNKEYAEAARALGLGHFGIILRHMIPNSLAPIIVSATLSLGG